MKTIKVRRLIIPAIRMAGNNKFKLIPKGITTITDNIIKTP